MSFGGLNRSRGRHIVEELGQVRTQIARGDACQLRDFQEQLFVDFPSAGFPPPDGDAPDSEQFTELFLAQGWMLSFPERL